MCDNNNESNDESAYIQPSYQQIASMLNVEQNNPEQLAEEVKKAEKRERNRQAAEASRKKRKREAEERETEIKQLKLAQQESARTIEAMLLENNVLKGDKKRLEDTLSIREREIECLRDILRGRGLLVQQDEALSNEAVRTYSL